MTHVKHLSTMNLGGRVGMFLAGKQLVVPARLCVDRGGPFPGPSRFIFSRVPYTAYFRRCSLHREIVRLGTRPQ